MFQTLDFAGHTDDDQNKTGVLLELTTFHNNKMFNTGIASMGLIVKYHYIQKPL